MSNVLTGTAATKKRTPTPATMLRIQNSCNGVPRPFGYGQARLPPNLLNYAGFSANAVSSSGGKGGGGGKSGSVTSYTYNASVAFGICEGPIDSIVSAYENKSAIVITGPTATNWSIFDGSYQQQPWDYLQTSVPSQAQNYRGIAYAAVEGMALGNTPELPNMTFEVKFAVSDALIENVTVPSTAPYNVAAQYYNWDFGVSVHFTVPVAAPYTFGLDAQGLASEGALVWQNGLAAAISGYDYTWALSNSSTILWDDGATNGTVYQPLTRISSGTPSSGEYLVTGSLGNEATWTFAAADAGQPVVALIAALSPGVYYSQSFTATTSAGSATLTVPSPADITVVTVGQRITGGAGIPSGTFIAGISGGQAEGITTSGSTSLGNLVGSYSVSSGTSIYSGVLYNGTTVVSSTPASCTLSNASGGTASQAQLSVEVGAIGGTFETGGQYVSLISTTGVLVGAAVNDAVGVVPLNTTVAGISGSTVELSQAAPVGSGYDEFYFSYGVTADLTQASAALANISAVAPLVSGASVTDPFGFLPSGTTVSTAGAYGTMTISHAAPGTYTGVTFTFGSDIIMSQAATASGTGPVTFRDAELQQTLANPSEGQFVLSVQAGSFGTYEFSSSDANKTMEIVDLPDANPADVLTDFLTNPYYGMTQFPLARIGNLATYRSYCLAAGLVVSPVVTTQAQANSFLQDLMKATNSELVWSGGLLTAVPYGDTALSANGATYTPPAAPIYSLDDEDFLDNQGTNPKSVSAASTPDPVTITRTDLADQENDIKLEYLDRAINYNPTIVEAQDDAAISLFGLKNSGSKQMHLFCNATAALNSAQLQLGRESILRTFSFTLGREYVLLDPMDIVAITDINAGLSGQWVRIKEITENDDRSFSITAEEYLEGTGTAPLIGTARPLSTFQNYNVAAPAVNAPIFLDVQAQLPGTSGPETIICASGSGPNWGGADVWVSLDGVNYKYAATLSPGSVTGITTATFPYGGNPDTTNTCSVDLTQSKGMVLPATEAMANAGLSLCYVCNADGTNGELFSFEEATLTAQYKYNLGPGYLRRGLFGTTSASHATDSLFALLENPESYVTVPYSSAQIGQTIYAKFLSFNQYGGGMMTLDQATAYSHTIGGASISLPIASLAVTPMSAGSGLMVTWTWPTNASLSATGDSMFIYRNTSNNFSTATWIGSVAYPGTEYPDLTATAAAPSGTTYYYWVVPYGLTGIEVPGATGPVSEAASLIGTSAINSGGQVVNSGSATNTSDYHPGTGNENPLVSVSITTVGGEVAVTASSGVCIMLGSSNCGAQLVLYRDDTQIDSAYAFPQLGSGYVYETTPMISFLDTGAAAGAHTYTLAWAGDGTNDCSINGTVSGFPPITISVSEYKR